MPKKAKSQTKIFGLSTSGIIVLCGLCLCGSIASGILRPSENTARQPVAAATQEVQATEVVPTEVVEPSPTPRPTNTERPAATATPQFETGQVVRILDGDTIEVDVDGTVYRVRYIGVSTPDKDQPCFTESTQANVGLVYQQTVRLVKDVSNTDVYERLLRYVYVGDTFVNAVLVRQGWAEAEAFAPDTAQSAYFEGLESEARNAGRGCHPLGAFSGVVAAAVPTSAPALPVDTAAPVIQPTQPPVAAAPPANVGYACAGGQACIKGNINGEGEKIYHYPGCRNYDDTQINEGKGERWFSTGAEAEAAGWRMARNC